MGYVQQLTVKNYRCFAEFSAALTPGLNVVTGSSGAGKTSLLKATACALAAVAFRCRAEGVDLMPDDVRRQAVARGGRLRFEPCFPGECSIQWQSGSQKTEFSQKMKGLLSSPSISESGDGAAEAVGDDLPLLAFYQANRQWLLQKSLSEVSAVSKRNSRRDGCLGWFNAADNLQAFHQWLIERSIARLQLALDRQVGFWQVEDDELAEANRALKKALPGEFESIAYDMSAKAVVVKISGKQVDFTLLSDGERAFIGLFTDIARRMCLLNPQFGDKIISETEGVVLVDELEAHRHPAWQKKIVKELQAAFPKVPFIVTTHSSEILREVAPQQILLLQEGKAVHPELSAGCTSEANGQNRSV